MLRIPERRDRKARFLPFHGRYGGPGARRPGGLPCRTFRPRKAVPSDQRNQEKAAYAGKHVS